jgi:hypothetical protein
LLKTYRVAGSVVDGLSIFGLLPIASPSMKHDRTGHALDCRDNHREAIGEVVSVARKQAHAAGISQSHNAEAVVFDLVSPALTSRRLFGRPRKGCTPDLSPDGRQAAATGHHPLL